MGGMIEYRANGGTAQGYLARPDTGGVGRGVIVIQEWWGLAPHIKDLAERFARLGYTALAPDLWDGKVTTDPDEAGRMFMALRIDDAARKLSGAVAALHGHGASGKVAVVGFCMGGQLALYAAGALPDHIGAVVDFYGVHPHVRPDYDRIKAPVLGIFGEKDEFVTPAAAREIQANVEAAGGHMESHLYPAGHAFFNDARPEAYHAASAADAWQKVQDFLARNLA
jgi:carboxymethylenebutenolidase